MNTFQKHNNAAEASTREQLQSHPQSYVVNVVESDADKKNANKSTTTNKKKKKSVSFGTLEVKYVLDYRNIMTKQAKDAYWYNSQDYKVFQNNYEYKVERDHERIQKERVHHYAKKIAEPQAKKEQKKNKKIKYNHHNNNNNTHTNSMGAFTRSFASRMAIIKNGRNEPNNSSERLCPPLLRKFVRKGISKQPHSNDNNKNADFDIVIDPVASHKALTELEAFLKKNKSTRRLV
jgi:hypothetical protein